MIKFEKLETPVAVGARIILFWLISFTFLYNSQLGDHIILGFGLLNAETSLQLSIWREN
tara:strand:+ start:177 stop:353 length:177 start_codon:yes stop_codon:yes gene_type:complete